LNFNEGRGFNPLGWNEPPNIGFSLSMSRSASGVRQNSDYYSFLIDVEDEIFNLCEEIVEIRFNRSNSSRNWFEFLPFTSTFKIKNACDIVVRPRILCTQDNCYFRTENLKISLNNMKYLNFFNDEKVLSCVEGSSVEEVDRLEKELGVRIPGALKEYLLLMGVKPIDKVYDEQGTNDMKMLYEWIYEDIEEYRAQGFALNEIRIILPFERVMDNYFYVPVEDGVEDPPVMTLVIGSIPIVKLYAESIGDFIKPLYEWLLEKLHQVND